jgi:hypothetical protein
LRAFSVDELSVIVEPGPNALLAAAVRGQAPEGYARRLEESIESVRALVAAPVDFRALPQWSVAM